MRRRYFLCLSLATLWAATATASAESPEAIRVLSYNIHHGEGADGRLDLERIASVIRSAKPDLVALQEVDKATKRSDGVDQVAKLAQLTGMNFAYGRAMDYQGGEYGVAMLSRWPVQDGRTHPLPIVSGVEPRVVLEGTVALTEGGPKIRFLVTHVDHRADSTQRALQLARLRELFPPSEAEVPSILAGDFNATPDSEVIKAMRNEWTDSAAGKDFFTSPASSPRRRIDYIFVRPAAKWRVLETKALDEAVASDHRPVLAVLQFR